MNTSDNKITYKEYKDNYNKLYYEKNKEKLLNNCKIKIYCDICRCEYVKSSKTNHENSNKHKNAIYLKNLYMNK